MALLCSSLGLPKLSTFLLCAIFSYLLSPHVSYASVPSFSTYLLMHSIIIFPTLCKLFFSADWMLPFIFDANLYALNNSSVTHHSTLLYSVLPCLALPCLTLCLYFLIWRVFFCPGLIWFLICFLFRSFSLIIVLPHPFFPLHFFFSYCIIILYASLLFLHFSYIFCLPSLTSFSSIFYASL